MENSLYLAYLLLLLAAVGLLTCTGFLCLLVIASLRFRRRPGQQLPAELPPVTLLKPLCGLEPNLKANLASFFEQDYPAFEIIFGTRVPQRSRPCGRARGLRRAYPWSR